MIYGLFLRNMGPQSAPDIFTACARAADRSAIDELWIADHVAIPPEDAEGSGGRYLDPLASLAFLAAATERVRIGTGVLVLPYRPPLPTAKQIATIQELSGNRMMLGVGAGWMRAEFKALGVDRASRGKITDDTLAFLHRCFDNDKLEANGQEFLFLPRPPRPPIFVGGNAPHALRRAVRFGEGWMPVGGQASALAEPIKQMHALADESGKPRPETAVITSLALDDPPAARATVLEMADVGVTRIIHTARYDTAAEFATAAEAISMHMTS